ncbi:uncharacterized protein LOC121432197 [Lytechinus variegatus]|uniref:uncharacterized protein LOC121432197 n=1 Tax=Lytechinus variegatus TaxID=7654 RepID=UPI001BB17158|nr:uncharacterized protein LOC121432197 [Lytechinus variegatus]
MASVRQIQGDTAYLLPPTRRVKVTVCSSNLEENVSGLIQHIQQRLPDVVEMVEFRSLPYNISDIEKFDLRGIDVLLLCHSMNNRLLSITDVTDALYDRFLTRAKKYLGTCKVGVIAHDFQEDFVREFKMSSFRRTQPRTFKCASLVLIGGQLSRDQVELTEKQLGDVKQFFYQASHPSRWERFHE